MVESLKSIAVSSGKPFTIADYGCADGGTSMPLMYACVEELRNLHGNELEIHINYEDRPENDYNSVFYYVQGEKKTYDSENNELLFIVYVDDVLRKR